MWHEVAERLGSGAVGDGGVGQRVAVVHPQQVDRVASPHVGMTFDVGHAHITADRQRAELRPTLEAALDAVVLFHLHDNLGARRVETGRAGPDPRRLDLHLAPGAGALPWDSLAATLGDHRAPLVLEVHPPHRPQPLSLVTVTTELLLARRSAPAASRRAVDPGPERSVPAG